MNINLDEKPEVTLQFCISKEQLSIAAKCRKVYEVIKLLNKM